MSEAGTFDAGSGPSFTAFSAGGGGFRSDTRYASAGEIPPAHAPAAANAPEPEVQDPLTLAFTEGFTAGFNQAKEQAAEQARQDAAARQTLDLSFARLDRELTEELRLRLRDTVAALCEAALAPLALDEDALVARIERAVAMLARADDNRLIRLHPEDLVMVAPRLTADWHVVPDPTLERGALRIESDNGGVEDGPEDWRRAIAEALRQC